MVKDLLRTFDNASLNNPTTNMAATDVYPANDASDVIAASAAGDDNDVSDDANVGGEVCRRLPHGTMQHDTSLRGGRGRERIAAVNQTQNNDAVPAHYDNDTDGVRGEERRQVARRQPSYRRQDQVLGGAWTDAAAVRRSISQSSAPCAARSASLVDRDRPSSARNVTSSASLVARRQAPRDDRLDSRQLPRRRSLSSASLPRQQQWQQQQRGRSRPNRQASH